MTQNVPTQFNYAGINPAGDFLPSLKLEEGKSVLVNFLDKIPDMQSPPFVYCKVHWNSEMGDNGRLFQCFGGSCCEQVTWQKGWGGEPGKFETNKARTRYYIPVVHYEPDPKNPAVTVATIKYIDMTWTAFNALCIAIQNTEGLSFYERDVILTAQKVNGATSYIYDKRDGQAQWLSNPTFKEQVEQQLPTVAQRLLNSMPKLMTEAEFQALKPELDRKVQAAMGSQQATQAATQSVQAGFGTLPTNVPPVGQIMNATNPPQFTQPVVNVPIQAQPATTVASTAAVNSETVGQAVDKVETEVATQELPNVDLNFDASALLK